MKLLAWLFEAITRVAINWTNPPCPILAGRQEKKYCSCTQSRGRCKASSSLASSNSVGWEAGKMFFAIQNLVAARTKDPKLKNEFLNVDEQYKWHFCVMLTNPQPLSPNEYHIYPHPANVSHITDLELVSDLSQ